VVANALSASAITCFAVIKPTGSSGADWNAISTTNISDYWRAGAFGGAGYFGAFRSARVDNYPASVLNTGPVLVAIISTASTYNNFIDEVSQTAQSAAFYAGDGFVVGSQFGGAVRFFPGDIAEIVVYNSQLSSPDMDTVSNYLRGKWNF